jgi:hypothetical protein
MSKFDWPADPAELAEPPSPKLAVLATGEEPSGLNETPTW